MRIQQKRVTALLAACSLGLLVIAYVEWPSGLAHLSVLGGALGIAGTLIAVIHQQSDFIGDWGPLVLGLAWTAFFVAIVGHYYPDGVMSDMMMLALLGVYTGVMAALFIAGAVVIAACENQQRASR